MARASRKAGKRKPDPPPSSPLAAAMEHHLEALRSQNYSEYTVKNRRVHIGFFLTWAGEHGLADPLDITRPILERYQLMETLYSTGMRRLDLASLKLYDLDAERGTVMIRQGKGKKDR